MKRKSGIVQDKAGREVYCVRITFEADDGAKVLHEIEAGDSETARQLTLDLLEGCSRDGYPADRLLATCHEI